FSTTRGPGTPKFDADELRRAELTLLEAQKKNQAPAVRHALGKVYLAKQQFDEAIREFDEDLKTDNNNAQLYSDLGAAWLEKGKIDRDGKEPGKGMEELGQAQENLSKAVELNPNLLEAHPASRGRLARVSEAGFDFPMGRRSTPEIKTP